MLIICFVLIVVLIIIASIEIPRGGLGSFERKRRMRDGKSDDLAVERELYYDEIVSLQRSLQALLLVIFGICITVQYGWLMAFVAALGVIVTYGYISRRQRLRSWSLTLYGKVESRLLALVARHESLFALLRAWPLVDEEQRLHSRDELVYLIQQSHSVLDDEEKRRLIAGVEFNDRVVKTVMTPRSMIESIPRSELLGPLVLDELHKKGHSRFPVIDQDIDHVVGILHLRDVLTLDTSRKHTSRVETAMDNRAYYIHEDQQLSHALSAFITTHHHMFVVINEFRETVGLLTLEDVIEVLIGHEIVDEFDGHDDLRQVAKRVPRANKRDASHTDI